MSRRLRPYRAPVVVTLAACVAVLAPAGALPTRASLAGLPLTFERNTGHWPEQVEFVARSGQGTLFLTKREMVLSLRKGDKGAALRLKLQGSNPKAVASGLEKQPGIVNYFIGNDPKKWRTRVPTYSRVKLAGVYPGVDLVTYGAGKSRTLEYDFVVRPGADTKRIRMAVSGAKSLRSVGGRLIASTSCGDVTLNRPYAYQTIDGVRKQVACSFTLERNTVAFEVARYDASRPLVVDPTLEYSTFLGGALDDSCQGIQVDSTGAVYACGYTSSSAFPTSGTGFDRTFGGTEDGFVTKLSSSGAGLVYSTFLGGAGGDYCWDIAVDAAGQAVVTGGTDSGGFPTTLAAYDRSLGGSSDAFVTRLNATGSVLMFSTFIGGTGTYSEEGHGVALDSTGNAVVCGSTQSPSFPTTIGAYDRTHGGGWDGFVVKLTVTGGELRYGTFLGGAGEDSARCLALDAAGAPIVCGQTASAAFPTTPGAYDTALAGADGFVTKLSADFASLVYSTFLGGSLYEDAKHIAVDSAGAAYVCGNTSSSDFPTTTGAYDETHNGGSYDAFVVKLSPDGSSLNYGTLLGGSGTDYGLALALDADGSPYVCGYTASTDFPTTAGAYDTTHNGVADVYVARLSADLSALRYSTLMGSPNWDICECISVNSAGVVALGGRVGTGFPVTTGAYDTSFNGASQYDAFVARFGFAPATTSLSATGATGQVGEMVEFTATLTSGGSPVDGATVEFTTPDSVTTSRTTNASGVANLWYDIPVGAVTDTVAVAYQATDSYQAADTTAALTVSAVATVKVSSFTGKQGEALTLYAYLWQGRTTAGLTGKQLTYRIDGGPAVDFASLTAGTFGMTTTPYTVPGAMSAGAHTLTVDWAGGGGYPASQGTSTLTVNVPARTYLWVHSHGATRNAATKLTCYLYDYRRNGDLVPVPGKSISFSVGGTPVGTAVTATDGKAFRVYTPVATGALTQTLSFAGDAAYSATSNTGALTVTP
ncbi:MAG: SBBP repeat-containing protein [Armatimonadetes bacterium]|nr:SBBP repeat-containing protein [Armatimonadota bacterium]